MSPAGKPPRARPRDPRLDFFRGLAMFIIVMAHTPGNVWTLWIPARFGFSDAAEIFVFCSGMASAIAFGGTFASRGWILGAVRTLFRVWQVYWAHIGAFLVTAALMAVLTAAEVTGKDYVDRLNLWPFFTDPATNLPALLTLSYVPNYFDILPMYLVILAMLPLAVALARVHVGLVAVAAGTLWLAANLGQVALPAEPWSERAWFFNPFGWQLLFFTGFGFMAGWLPSPRVSGRGIAIAVAILILSLPFAYFRLRHAVPFLDEAAGELRPLTAKSPFGLLRYVHFLALAYLAWIAVGVNGVRLRVEGRSGRVVAVIRKVGQQSLAVFVTGIVLAQLLGVLLDLIGRGPLQTLAANLLGMAGVIATAYFVGWIKSVPWKRAAATKDAPDLPRAGEGVRPVEARP
ncbi:MAG: OpgC domain-containing protein [Rhodobacteraceae bacterium]|nr:OpgC domain-containing protein [Paracoccaceae bacterium]